MKKKLIKYSLYSFSLIIGIILFDSLFRFTNINLSDVIEPFRTLYLPYLCVFIMITLISKIIVVYRWNYILKKQGYKNIPFISLFFIRLVGMAVSYVTPSAQLGGEPIRAYLLKKDHKVPTSTALSSVILDKSMELLLIIFIVFTSFIISIFLIDSRNFLFSSFIFTIILLLFYFLYKQLKSNQGLFSALSRKFGLSDLKIFRQISKTINQIKKEISIFMKHKKNEMRVCLFLSIIALFFSFFEIYFILLILGYSINLFHIFLILIAISVAYLLPIPAAIGVMEAGQILVFSLFGLSISSAISVVILLRARDILYTMLGFIYLFFHGANFIRSFIESGINLNNK